MRREEYEMIWSMIASGVAANPHRQRSAVMVADETDKIVEEFIKRRDLKFPREAARDAEDDRV